MKNWGKREISQEVIYWFQDYLVRRGIGCGTPSK
jgi:hypothetical protein